MNHKQKKKLAEKLLTLAEKKRGVSKFTSKNWKNRKKFIELSK